MTVKFFTSVLVPLCILIPIIAALVKVTVLDKTGKIILLYLLAGGMVETAATITGRVFHRNNLWFSHVYAPVEMAFILLFYFYLFNIKRNSKWYLLAGSAFVFVCILNALVFQPFFTYSSYTRSLEALVCILFALNFYARLAALDINVNRLPGFYFNTGLFLYFSGAFMLFLFSNFSIFGLSGANFNVLWIIHSIMLLVMYLSFTTGFILCKK